MLGREVGKAFLMGDMTDKKTQMTGGTSGEVGEVSLGGSQERWPKADLRAIRCPSVALQGLSPPLRRS